MQKKLLYLVLLIPTFQIWSQQVTITEASGWLESAFVKWEPLNGADSYNVYYTGGGQTNKKIDNELIRSYGTYFRADVPGLTAGSYTLTVKPVIAAAEGTGTTSPPLAVKAHDRTGFAFYSGRIPGAYKADGTPKDNAVVLYITQNTKNTVSLTVAGIKEPCIGLQPILNGFKKGSDTRPLIVRMIGQITTLNSMEAGDIVIENKENTASYITLEGMGDDAVADGWGIRIKNATNIEIRNIGMMKCKSTEGDNIGLQQKNTHIWVHHCDMFYGEAGKDADQIKGDGTLDCKGSTYVTMSYNHFWDSGKSCLLGLSEGTTTGLYITYHHNWFDHSDSRHPRVRFYSAHIYNNYFDGVSKYGSGATLGSSLFVEGNYFRNTKNPIMISMQGTDIWDESKQQNDLTNMPTFSKEDGGSIKAYNNKFDADIATNRMRFVAYGDPTYTIPGKTDSTVHFDAYVVANRNDQVPSTVKSSKGGNSYSNFDTDPNLYIKDLIIESPDAAKATVMQYSGRVLGGDFKWAFNDQIDDTSDKLNTALKQALTNYKTKLVAVQGEQPEIVSTQTIVSDTDNDQIVTQNTAIEDMIFVWGGDATDVTVDGLPASGITFIKDMNAKTITVSGTPTANVSFKITTNGTTGTPVSMTGSVTLESNLVLSGMIHNFSEGNGLDSDFYIISRGSNKPNLATNRGTVHYDGHNLTRALRVESSLSITFKTTQPSTLTLVFSTHIPKIESKIKINNTTYTSTSGVQDTNTGGIITVELPAGEHAITRVEDANIFYMKTSYKNDPDNPDDPTLGSDQNFESGKLVLYPNPAANKIFISSENIQKVEIYNLLGMLIKSVNNSTEIDIVDLTAGTYIFKVTTDQGTSINKIIKQ